MILEKADGPECPRCGCCASTVKPADARWGQVRMSRRCDHCGFRWFDALPLWPTKKKTKAAVAAAAGSTRRRRPPPEASA